ncbi:MAG: penicillin-binding protein 2 [Pseudomonadota bacterium]
MAKLPTLKDAELESALFRRRLLVGVSAMLFGIVILLLRLVFLQVLSHDHFTTLSHDNRLRVLPIPPPRGVIYSRDGVVLAENRPSFSLVAAAERSADLMKETASLGELLPIDDAERSRFEDQLKRVRRFEEVTYKADLSHQELAVFAVNSHRFPAFQIRTGLARHYPLGEAFAHAVGYVGRISERDLASIDENAYVATTHIGKSGVERARENVLHGEAGFQTVEVNAQGRILRVVDRTPPIAGNDVYLSIDVALQHEAIAALEDRDGAIVALDPNSGGVLAFVSNPAFDPNLFVGGIAKDDYQALRDSPRRPLFNRALQGQYPPGSTIKMMVALAGLETQVREPAATTWCPGWYSLPDSEHRYRDWLKDGHGHVDLKTSIARSCDVYYYALANDLGIARMHEWLRRFGFGQRTGIDVPGESQGLLPSPAWKRRQKQEAWFPGETLITGIGQGFMLATPLQLAYATSIVANGGQVRIPHLVDQIESSGAVEPIDAEVYFRPPVTLEDSSRWQVIVDAMVEVVHGDRGTARGSAHGAQFRYAGKTGTAQVVGIAQDVDPDDQELPEHLQDHGLFVAFAPVDFPSIAVAVIVENGGSGSRAAAPIARRLFDLYFSDRSVAGFAGD